MLDRGEEDDGFGDPAQGPKHSLILGGGIRDGGDFRVCGGSENEDAFREWEGASDVAVN